MKGRHIFFTITALCLPFVLLMNAIILIFTPAYLVHEYKRPDFPPDPYGFTLEERIEYGTESVNYITDFSQKYHDNYLAELKMKDGSMIRVYFFPKNDFFRTAFPIPPRYHSTPILRNSRNSVFSAKFNK